MAITPSPAAPVPKDHTEAFLASVLEATADYGVIGADLDGIVLLWNTGAEKIFGITAAEVIGNPDIGSIHKLLGVPTQKFNDVMHNAGREGKWEGVIEHHHRDGTPTKTRWTVSIRLDESGKHVGYVALVRNVTQDVDRMNIELELHRQTLEQNERTREDLHEADIRLQQLLDNVQDHAILMLDAKGNILSWNKSAQKIMGFEQAEAVGKHFRLFYTAEDITNGKTELLLQRAREEASVEEEGLRQIASGSLRWMNVVISSIWETSTLLRGYAVVMRDMTERKQSEDALHRFNTELEQRVMERVRDLDQLSTSVSHDLRAPLLVINGFGKVLQREHAMDLNPEGRAYLNHIVDSSERMMTLIADLLRFARLGNQTIVMQPVDLNEIATKTLAAMKPQIAEATGIVTFSDNLPRVMGCPVLIQQVFNNLVENGLKYRRADRSPTVQVLWKPAERHQCVTIFFQDNGIGIPNQFLDQIFNVFTRLHAQDEFSGTGIGLSIVQRAIGLMGGKITVNLTVGEGSRFEVSLTLANPPV